LNDDLQPLKNRLRWLNRSILALGILILLGLIVWAVVGLRKPEVGASSTVIHPASSASNLLTRAASAVVASTPGPAMSTAQQEISAAAAMDALSAASAPIAAGEASQPVASSAPSEMPKAPEAASPAAARPTVALPVAPAAVSKPAPKPQQHKAAAHVSKQAQASSRAAAAKPQRVGATPVCRTGGWYVQVGAFGKQQSIDRLAQRLHRAGYTKVSVAAREVRGLHLFYVGPYRDAAAARAARAPLHKLTGAEGILRKLP
jgi:cell division septation protein DedD